MELNKLLKKTLLCSAGVVALGVSPAFAQIEEIVITAQKREQSMNDVGVSVSAFTGDDMKDLGMTQPIDLAGQTTGLSIGNALGGSNPAITIRGIGINDFNVNTNPGVAVYVDEIYQPVPAALSFGLFDMERVEVLKGPQGTLYGRNATGGAVSFITRGPTDEFDGFLSADVGNFKYANIEAAIGGPLSDSVRWRLSGFTQNQNEGYQNVINPTTGDIQGDHGRVDRYGFRVQGEWDIADNFDIAVNYTYGRDTSQSPLPTILDEESSAIPGFTTLEVNQLYYYTAFAGPAGGYNNVLLTDPSHPPSVDMESDSVVVKMNYDLDIGTLTFVSGYLNMDHSIENDFAGVEGVAQDIVYGGNVEQFSEELRLTSSEGEMVDWIVGLYYSKTEQANRSDIFQDFGVGYLTYLYGLTNFGDPVGAATIGIQEQTSMGIFAHTEWHVTDQWKITAAARSSKDDLDYDAAVIDTSVSSVPGVPYPQMDLWNLFLPIEVRTGGVIASNSDHSNSENSFTWKLGVDYQLNDDVLFFGHVSTGFKNQGFFGGLGPLSSQYTAYQPEEVLNTELGVKASFANNTLQINGSIFRYQLDDPQVIVSEDIALPTPNDVLWNVAEAEGKGGEVDITWAPTNSLIFKLGASYLVSELTDVSVTGKTLMFPLVEGAPMSYSPEWTYNGLVRYNFEPLQNVGPFVQVDFDRRGDALSFAGRPDTALAERTLFNARIGMEDLDGRWEVSLWGKNLFDEEWSGYNYLILGPMAMHQAPLTYGVSVTVNLQ